MFVEGIKEGREGGEERKYTKGDLTPWAIAKYFGKEEWDTPA